MSLSDKDVIEIMDSMSAEDFVEWCQENYEQLPFGTWPSWLITKASRLQVEIVQLEDKRLQLQLELSDAAKEIHCAGTVAHRIRVLKREQAKHVAQLEAENEALKNALKRVTSVEHMEEIDATARSMVEEVMGKS